MIIINKQNNYNRIIKYSCNIIMQIIITINNNKINNVNNMNNINNINIKKIKMIQIIQMKLTKIYNKKNYNVYIKK